MTYKRLSVDVLKPHIHVGVFVLLQCKTEGHGLIRGCQWMY